MNVADNYIFWEWVVFKNWKSIKKIIPSHPVQKLTIYNKIILKF